MICKDTRTVCGGARRCQSKRRVARSLYERTHQVGLPLSDLRPRVGGSARSPAPGPRVSELRRHRPNRPRGLCSAGISDQPRGRAAIFLCERTCENSLSLQGLRRGVGSVSQELASGPWLSRLCQKGCRRVSRPAKQSRQRVLNPLLRVVERSRRHGLSAILDAPDVLQFDGERPVGLVDELDELGA